jgi:cobalamin biosynthesis protein CbiG
MSGITKLALAISGEQEEYLTDKLRDLMDKTEDYAPDEIKDAGRFLIDKANEIKERRERERKIETLKNMGIGAAGTLGVLGSAYLYNKLKG